MEKRRHWVPVNYEIDENGNFAVASLNFTYPTSVPNIRQFVSILEQQGLTYVDSRDAKGRAIPMVPNTKPEHNRGYLHYRVKRKIFLLNKDILELRQKS